MTSEIKNLIFFFITIVALSGCTEKIDLQLDESYTRLVVDGEITNEARAHKIRLTTTSSFLGGEPDPTVSGAIVSITDGDTIFQLDENPGEPGDYYTSASVHGVAGKTYTLNIALPHAIAEQQNYTASCLMEAIGTIDSIGLFHNEHWDAWEVQIYARDPLTTDFYMFDILKNNILLTDTLSEKLVVNDLLYNGQYTNGATVGYLNNEHPDEQLHEGDTVTVRMSSITKDYANFIWQAQMESGYSNPLFGGPPANIKGNIDNGAIGFFAAYSSTSASKVYAPK
jgi:hypothetical protein